MPRQTRRVRRGPPAPWRYGGDGVRSSFRRCTAAFTIRPPYGLLGTGVYFYCRGSMIRRKTAFNCQIPPIGPCAPRRGGAF